MNGTTLPRFSTGIPRTRGGHVPTRWRVKVGARVYRVYVADGQPYIRVPGISGHREISNVPLDDFDLSSRT